MKKCIFEALENKRNIVIPTMSAGYANQIYKAITAKYPELKVALYTTTSGGEDKKKLNNVDEYWNTLNVLIYSPTISAGVSFDKQHFDMMFGVICSRSCCARDYHQMLRRVRKIEDQNILIFNYSNFQLNDNVPHTTYEETKKYCLKVKDINLKRQYERNELTTKIVYIVDDYDQIYIYNKAEERNSHSDVFLTTFLAMADQKGFEYEIEAPRRDERSNTMDNKAHRINWKIEELLSAKDISHEEAEVLQMKTNRLEDTQDEKIQLDRYYIELKLGVDSLDEGILKHFQYGLHTIVFFWTDR